MSNRDDRPTWQAGQFMPSDGLSAPSQPAATGSNPPHPSAQAPSAPVSRAWLRYQSVEGAACEYELSDRTAIGRHATNDIQLLDLEISKAHLEISRTPKGFVLRDLSSANGTSVNGIEASEHLLKDGDSIELGNTRMRFHAAMAPMPVPKPRTQTSSVLESAQIKSGVSEGTVVTLVPALSDPFGGTSVFAEPMTEEFTAAESIDDNAVLRRDYERLRVAFDLSRAVGLETDLHNLGETLLARIRDVLPADTAVIISVDEGGGLRTLASYTERDEEEVRIPRAIIDQVLQKRDAVLTSDAQLDSALRSSHTVVGRQIRSALCVPLTVGLEVYGAIYLSSSLATGAYGERDLSLLRAIATPAALAVANARLVSRVERDARARAQLSRFLSPALVERVVNRHVSLETAGDKVLCSVLFADIRGFTAMSHGVAPEKVVSMLNEYFEAMVELIFMHGGVLDKFLGDGLMAVWGTPVTSPEDAGAAVRAGNRMREVLTTVVNPARARRGEPELQAGYGIATGYVVAGAMGATRRQDYTVIGDTVNLASRLCSGAAPGQLLVCETTRNAAAAKGFHFSALEHRNIKGFNRPVPVFELPRGQL